MTHCHPLPHHCHPATAIFKTATWRFKLHSGPFLLIFSAKTDVFQRARSNEPKFDPKTPQNHAKNDTLPHHCHAATPRATATPTPTSTLSAPTRSIPHRFAPNFFSATHLAPPVRRPNDAPQHRTAPLPPLERTLCHSQCHRQCHRHCQIEEEVTERAE
jgi:hypothetical protein